MTSAQSSTAVLAIVAIALLSGGVLGYSVSGTEAATEPMEVQQAPDDVSVHYEPLIDPGLFERPVAALGLTVGLSVGLFGLAIKRSR